MKTFCHRVHYDYYHCFKTQEGFDLNAYCSIASVLGFLKPVVLINTGSSSYNNNEYLERLTRTGPKRLHVLYKYIFVKIQCIRHEHGYGACRRHHYPRPCRRHH